jgi:hypothetical protein
MRHLLLLSACSVLALGCDDGPHYAGLTFESQSSPPVPVSIESDRIEIPAGIAVKVKATPESSGSQYKESAPLSLRADDDDLFAVYATEQDHEFVFVGLREGETCLEVRVNRKEMECIEVEVLPPE